MAHELSCTFAGTDSDAESQGHQAAMWQQDIHVLNVQSGS